MIDNVRIQIDIQLLVWTPLSEHRSFRPQHTGWDKKITWCTHAQNANCPKTSISGRFIASAQSPIKHQFFISMPFFPSHPGSVARPYRSRGCASGPPGIGRATAAISFRRVDRAHGVRAFRTLGTSALRTAGSPLSVDVENL
jgi:hypothetical protein